MNVKYIVVKNTYYSEMAELISYGVAMVESDGSDECVLKTYSDLSFCEQKVCEFVNKCNQNELSPVHFRDAVEDFLLQF